MSKAEPSVDALLADLERTLASLGDQSAPLDRLVSDHERAARLLRAAEQSLDDLGLRARRLQERISRPRS